MAMTPEAIDQLATALARLTSGRSETVASSREPALGLTVLPPDMFKFEEPRAWESWISYYERYRGASGLSKQSDSEQIDNLLYCMGP